MLLIQLQNILLHILVLLFSGVFARNLAICQQTCHFLSFSNLFKLINLCMPSSSRRMEIGMPSIMIFEEKDH